MIIYNTYRCRFESYLSQLSLNKWDKYILYIIFFVCHISAHSSFDQYKLEVFHFYRNELEWKCKPKGSGHFFMDLSNKCSQYVVRKWKWMLTWQIPTKTPRFGTLSEMTLHKFRLLNDMHQWCHWKSILNPDIKYFPSIKCCMNLQTTYTEIKWREWGFLGVFVGTCHLIDHKINLSV